MLRVQVGNLTTYHREEILIRPPGFGLHPMWPSYWITTKSSIEGGLADQMANSQALELTPVSTFLLVSLNDFLTRLWECLLHCLFCVCLGSKVEQLGWLWRGSQSDFCLTSFCVISFLSTFASPTLLFLSSSWGGLLNFEWDFLWCRLLFSGTELNGLHGEGFCIGLCSLEANKCASGREMSGRGSLVL